MTKKDFIRKIVDSVSVGGALPLNIPPQRIENIVENAIKTFRDNDDRATIEDILFIRPAGNCQVLDMPKDIKAIMRLEFTSNGTASREFSGIIDEGRVFSSNGENDMLSYVTREAYYQLVREMGVRFMPYDFSEYTHKLVLEGDLQNHSLFAEVARYIPEDALFNIDDFREYCEAKLTYDWCKANKFLKIKLPQGREIDWQDMKEDAKEILTAFKEKWDEQGSGFIMTD